MKLHVQFECYNNATKPEVIENMMCEVTGHLKDALNSGMTSLRVMVAEV